MAGRIEALPEQIEEALERYAREPWRLPEKAPALLAVGAMGGSAIAADLATTLYRDRLPLPVLVVRDYRWPACVTRDSLALLCSYSGNTEETLALFHEAVRRGVPRLALSTGGRLAEECAALGVGCASLPGGSPPRAAVFASWVAISRLLHALGWIADPAPAWAEAASALRAGNATLGPSAPERDNPAKRLARAVHNRMLLIYAGSETLGAVATRWRTQLNENAKLPAHSALVPELNHNEIVGWERPGALHRQTSVLVLRDAEDAQGVARRLTLTAEYARRQGAEVHEISSGEGGRLGRLASLVQWGDYLSLYLALLSGVDPTPIASIDEFKRRLAEQSS
jgi:glucose/mannose-6-phosphate isomerase